MDELQWSWSELVLLGVLCICVATDLRSRKIYNAVVFPSLAAALIGHLLTGGWGGALQSISGFAAGLLLLIVPYLLGGMGAGDVKLLALVGALQGPSFALDAALYMGMLGLLLSVLYLLAQKKTRRFLKVIVYMLYAWRSGVYAPMPQSGDAMSATVPYGVAIAGGALTVMLWRGVVSG